MYEHLSRLEKKLGIRFHNARLLRQAFTHTSYVNEHRSTDSDNERLEFLGDAVLELAISDFLFSRYKRMPEGELTKLRASIVCESSLAQFARRLQFGDYVLLGKGEEQTGGRERSALLADLFEAFIGALYLDAGMEAVRRFLREHVYPELDDHQATPRFADYKTQLQEIVQQRGTGTLEYRVIDASGPAHDRQFSVEVRLGTLSLGSGTGRSKKEAEQQAAAKAIQKLGSSEGQPVGPHGNAHNEQVQE